MRNRAFSARALGARGLKSALFAASTLALIGLSSSAALSAPKDIRWGTGPIGSSGHKALVVLADVLNKAMPELRISVLPTPGAVGPEMGYSRRGDVTGELRTNETGAGAILRPPHIRFFQA